MPILDPRFKIQTTICLKTDARKYNDDLIQLSLEYTCTLRADDLLDLCAHHLQHDQLAGEELVAKGNDSALVT